MIGIAVATDRLGASDDRVGWRCAAGRLRLEVQNGAEGVGRAPIGREARQARPVTAVDDSDGAVGGSEINTERARWRGGVDSQWMNRQPRGARRFRRDWKRAVRRLREIAEGSDALERVGVGGEDAIPAFAR